MDRNIVRIALMRSTIHLVTAEDCVTLRPVLQSVQDRALRRSFGKKLAELDLDALAAAGRALLEAQPLTFSELGKRLQAQWPQSDATAIAQAVRCSLPLVQVPPRGIWGPAGRPPTPQRRLGSAARWHKGKTPKPCCCATWRPSDLHPSRICRSGPAYSAARGDRAAVPKPALLPSRRARKLKCLVAAGRSSAGPCSPSFTTFPIGVRQYAPLLRRSHPHHAR